ncbi:MAG: ABC transporter permease subunit, partial [Candidatus Limnocylindria bacterium]
FAISFVLALLIRRLSWLEGPIIGVSGVLYAIPSLALFALLIPFTGVRNPLLTAEIALVSYTILILLRNILAGLAAVPREVIEAADGMGYTPSQRLWKVELPVALPVIVAGLRIATVTIIGLVTVTALIGLGGLGYLIVDVGYRRFFLTATIVGSVGAVLLAVSADLRAESWSSSAKSSPGSAIRRTCRDPMACQPDSASTSSSPSFRWSSR